MTTVSWKHEPDEHDYPAAAAYLSLLATDDVVTAVVDQLRASAVAVGKAKDLLRASQLELLPVDNQHVAKDAQKIRDGVALSPVLLVRGDVGSAIPLLIADGYHRVCASYHFAENTDIPYRIAELPGH